MNQLVRMQINKGNDALNSSNPLQALVWYGDSLSKNQSHNVATQDDDLNSVQTFEAHSILRRQGGIVRRQLPKLLHCLTHNPAGIESAYYSVDGSRIVTTSEHLVRLWDSLTGKSIAEPLMLDGNITRAAFSPSGRLLFVLSARLDQRGMDPSGGRIDILDARTGVAAIPTIKIDALNVLHLSVAPDENFFAVAAGQGVHVLNLDTGKSRLPPIDHRCRVCQVEISPDGTRLASCGHDIESSAMAVLYDLESESEIGRWKDKLVNSVGDYEYLYTDQLPITTGRSVFSPDSQWFATFQFDATGGRASGPQIADLRNSQTGELAQELPSRNWIESVRFSLDSQQAFVHSGGTPLVYRVRDGQAMHLNLSENIEDLHFLSDGTLLTVKNLASVTDVRHHVTGSPDAMTFRGQPENLRVRDDSSGFALSVRAAEKNRGELHLYDFATQSTVSLSAWHRNIHAEYHPHTDRLLEVRHGVARQWDLAAHSSRRVDLSGFVDDKTTTTALSPSGRILAIGSEKRRPGDDTPKGTLRFVSLPPDAVLSEVAQSHEFPWSLGQYFGVGPSIALPDEVREIRFCCTDESKVAVLVDQGKVYVPRGRVVFIDATASTVVAIAPDEDRYVYQIAWQDDCTLAMLVSNKGPQFVRDRLTSPTTMYIETWSVDPEPQRMTIRELPAHRNVSLSPRGNRLLLTTTEGQTQWLDAVSGDLLTPLGRLPQPIDQVVFSDDQRRVAIIFQDQRLGVWDTKSGERIAPLLPDVRRARFSCDGSELITDYQGESVRLWNADTSDPLSLAINVGQMKDTPSFVVLPWMSDDKQTLISTSDHGLRVWNISSDDRTPQEIQGMLWPLAVS